MRKVVRATASLLASLMIPGLRAACPDQTALDLLKHKIAYQRTEELDPLKGLSVIHVDVWMRGQLTGFYIRDRLRDFIPTVRMSYLYGTDGLQGGGTCPVEKDWRKCIEYSAGVIEAVGPVTTCAMTIDTHSVPRWEASPNNHKKRQIAAELRHEIEQKWQGVQGIVIRDFNTKDDQITMYLQMPDGEYYQGCGLRSLREPHCEGWHLFGQVPASSLKKWILERPYRLK